VKVEVQNIKPYSEEGSKKVQIEEMFDDISKRYDFLNHFLSMGIDRGWRKKVIKEIKAVPHHAILDIATGTGDVAIAASGLDTQITGLDLSEKMLDVAREKVSKRGINNIELIKGDSENLPYDDATFDVVTVSFGVRNFEDLRKGLSEMQRVLKPGGKLIILEFSYPSKFPVKQLYHFYNSTLLPFFGKVISGSSTAYTYLPESVKAFPEGQNFLDLLESSGFEKTGQKRLTFGISSLYTAFKG